MTKSVKALIAVGSNERCDALQALLESIDHIDAIYQANDAPTSLEVIKAHCFRLVLVDFSLFLAIQFRCNPAIIVLVEDRREQEHARAAGATQVFTEGSPANQLVATIESLLKIGNE